MSEDSRQGQRLPTEVWLLLAQAAISMAVAQRTSQVAIIRNITTTPCQGKLTRMTPGDLSPAGA